MDHLKRKGTCCRYCTPCSADMHRTQNQVKRGREVQHVLPLKGGRLARGSVPSSENGQRGDDRHRPRNPFVGGGYVRNRNGRWLSNTARIVQGGARGPPEQRTATLSAKAAAAALFSASAEVARSGRDVTGLRSLSPQLLVGLSPVRR